ncbi:hypothetical protein [Frankia sp. CcWB3]
MGGGLAASVLLLVGFAMIGAFNVFAFGALAGLWALGIAWIMVLGPRAIDRRVVRARLRGVLRGCGRRGGDDGGPVPCSRGPGTA